MAHKKSTGAQMLLRQTRHKVQRLSRSVPTWQLGLQQARSHHLDAGTQGFASSQIRDIGNGGSTLSNADDELKGDDLSSHAIIIDEAGRATEPDVMIAVTKHCKNFVRIIRVGDVKQLRATALSAKEMVMGGRWPGA